MNKLIELVFYTILFCTAVSLLIRGADMIKEVHVNIKNSIHNEAGYQVYADENKALLCSKADIISMLMQDYIEYDIMINGYEIMRHQHNKNNINYQAIKNEVYEKLYQYDSKGRIIKVMFYGI